VTCSRPWFRLAAIAAAALSVGAAAVQPTTERSSAARADALVRVPEFLGI